MWGVVLPEWQKKAACALADPGQFFSEGGRTPASATTPCQGCPVREDCLAFVLSSPYLPFGVWGGMEQWELRLLWEQERGLSA